MTGYPRGFVPLLLATLALVFASGLLLAPTTLAMHAQVDLPWRLPGSWRQLTAALHAAGGFAVLVLIGALWSLHMRSGWRRHRQRRSGALLVLLMLLMAVTAVAVYYLGDERAARVAALLHLACGALLAAPFLWHRRRGRREPEATPRARPRSWALHRPAAEPGVAAAARSARRPAAHPAGSGGDPY